MLKLSCLPAWLSRYCAVNTLFVSAEKLCFFAGIRLSVSEKDGIFWRERKLLPFSPYFKGCVRLCQSGFSGQAGKHKETQLSPDRNALHFCPGGLPKKDCFVEHGKVER